MKRGDCVAKKTLAATNATNGPSVVSEGNRESRGVPEPEIEAEDVAILRNLVLKGY
jgi:hypothetical protein